MNQCLLGRERSLNENFFNNCAFTLASGEELPYQDNSFDLVTVGFGIRNFTDKLSGLKEMKRVLNQMVFINFRIFKTNEFFFF